MQTNNPDKDADQQGVTPMGIARNDLFTAKEKIDLLNQLKADVTVAQQEGLAPPVTLDDIEQAISEVHKDIEEGHGTETVLRGEA